MKKTKILAFGLILSFTLAIINPVFVGAKALKSTVKSESKQTLTISAAASLKDALSEIQRNFEKKNTSVKLLFNFGGSGALEKQIEAGAPVDVFLSADAKNITKLDDKKLVEKNSIKDIATNQLVLVAYSGKSSKVKKIDDLAKPEIENICLGTLISVPAGDYAKETLTYFNLWDKVSNKIVYAKDVSSVLNYVKLGNADAGFVYLTDAKKKSDAIIKQRIPEEAHSPIIYRGAVIASSQNKEACNKFMEYLNSTRSKTIFVKYGFGIPKK